MKARFTRMISLGLLANCTCMFAADADAPAGHAAPAAAPAFTAKIELDRVEFLLGDSIPAKFVMQNNSNVPERYAPGGIYPTLRLLKEFRLTAFKIDEQGKPANKPVTNWPMPMDFGGPRPIVGPFVQPGENRSTTLFITRSIRFDEPGKYLVRIENIDSADKRVYWVGETTITLKQPTPEEARHVYEKMKQAPRRAYDDNAMQFLAGAADFETMYQPVYLPILLEFAKQGDFNALPSLEKAESLEANEALISLIDSTLDRDQWQMAHECYLRIKPSVPFPNWYDKPEAEYDKANRQRVERTWKPEFGRVLTRLARRLMDEVIPQRQANEVAAARQSDAHSQELLEDIGYIYACVGTPDDFHDCLKAFDRSIELTKTLPLETHQYFRPRGSAFRFKYAVGRMLQRGAKPLQLPSHPGEMAAFMIALRTQENFRPDGWKDEVMKWLNQGPPYLSELILDYLPEPIPGEVLDYLPTLLAADYVDLQIAACHVAEKHPRQDYREPLKRILATGKEKFLRKFAVDAAKANGLSAEYDADAPFVSH